MKRFVLMGAVMALTTVLSATAVHAATILDFGSAAYAGANGQDSFVGPVTNGVTVTLTNASFLPALSGLYQDSDGIGVQPCIPFTSICGGDDEIGNSGGEVVISGFSPQDQYIQEVQIRKLFSNENPLETGQYELNGSGSWISFNANNPSGQFTLVLNAPLVDSIAFRTVPGSGFGSDFSVKSITVGSPVPEPATMILLGTGLLGAAAQRRRKKNQGL